MWPFRVKPSRAQAGPADGEPSAPEYGHYRIMRRENGEPWELGHGAMGITYKAEDINLRVPVALKIISPLIAEQPGAREFFLTEARGAASLRHRNAASIHHLGVNRAGELFFAMEFIAGETVETLIKRQRRLGVPLALDIAQQTACALAAAGQRCLVHRDIKPANLMLSDEGDGTLVVKVIDFGLAKQLMPSEAAVTSPRGNKNGSQTSQRFFGTPHYASPEQIRSDAALDHRSDFYSLGATLWTMLTGQPVFTGPMASIRQRHLEETPPFHELPSEVSEPVRALLASLLHKDPSGRPDTPLELIDRIELAAYDHRGAEADPRRHWKTQGCVPLVGSMLAHNYHLEALADERQGAESTPVFRAEDVAGQRPVEVWLMDRDQPLEAMRAAMERLAAAPHPNLIQHLSFSSCRGQPFIVNEWVDGFLLSEVLQARDGKLKAAEVQSLIHQAARALEHAYTHGLAPLDLRPAAIRVHFTGEKPGVQRCRALAAQPVETWPDFSLKFRLLARLETARADRQIAVTGEEALRLLSHLAAELLGNAPIITRSSVEPNPRERTSDVPGTSPEIRRLINQAIERDSGFYSATGFATAPALAFPVDKPRVH